MRVLSAWLAAVVAFGAAEFAFAQQAFVVAGTDSAAGQRTDLRVPVPAGDTDPATFIPVTVINGATSGPVLLVVAGVHGYEFAPILAVGDLAEQLDPGSLKGTVVLVRIANLAAFEQRTPYVNPFDRKNLNRAFPGSLTGTQTERIAAVLSSELIPKADFVIDVHSGDGAEWLDAFIGVYGGALATDYGKALNVAKAFGFPNLVRYRMETQQQVDRGRSLNRQAVAQKRPTLLVEIGENGRRDPAHVAAIVNGLRNALGVLGMVAGAESRAAAPFRSFDDTVSVNVGSAGIWTPVRAAGRDVRKDEVLGIVRDHHGRVVETVIAPIDGYALYGLAGPPVRAGDSVVTIAKPVASLD
jgi:predicted deacylase